MASYLAPVSWTIPGIALAWLGELQVLASSGFPAILSGAHRFA